MSTTITLHIPQRLDAPRAAVRLGEFFASALALMTHRRVTTPDLTPKIAAVRSEARRQQKVDPRFAAELNAVADYHESL